MASKNRFFVLPLLGPVTIALMVLGAGGREVFGTIWRTPRAGTPSPAHVLDLLRACWLLVCTRYCPGRGVVGWEPYVTLHDLLL